MKFITIVGARPQFIKAAVVGEAIRQRGHTEILVHTGQHYDYGMSQVFFDELGIPAPDINMGIGSGTHGEQTGRMLIALEANLIEEKPDWVLVYGDTNSTLAGALAAVKLQIPIAHVEAGLRSYNRAMPEETNRLVADHCSDALFCPSEVARFNLEREGITTRVFVVGDVMYDSLLAFSRKAASRSGILSRLGVSSGSYILTTIHRPSNTDDVPRLVSLLRALDSLGQKVILPLHPRTRDRLKESHISCDAFHNIVVSEPASYLEMLVLEQNAATILTDSGGVQKEAFFFGIPCVTLRHETEWTETVDLGWNVLAGDQFDHLAETVASLRPVGKPPQIYGDGRASQRIVQILEELR